MDHLIVGVAAALRYDNPEDKQSVELQTKIREMGVRDAVREITGLTDEKLLISIEEKYHQFD